MSRACQADRHRVASAPTEPTQGRMSLAKSQGFPGGPLSYDGVRSNAKDGIIIDQTAPQD